MTGSDSTPLSLTPEERMLVQIRDTLYEGNWDDFLYDLRARAADRPHVFQIGPDSPQMKATVASHIQLIQRMREWESENGRRLAP